MTLKKTKTQIPMALLKEVQSGVEAPSSLYCCVNYCSICCLKKFPKTLDGDMHRLQFLQQQQVHAKQLDLPELERKFYFCIYERRKDASLDPLIAGFWVFLGSSCNVRG